MTVYSKADVVSVSLFAASADSIAVSVSGLTVSDYFRYVVLSAF